jgi:hypothetical protein
MSIIGALSDIWFLLALRASALKPIRIAAGGTDSVPNIQRQSAYPTTGTSTGNPFDPPSTADLNANSVNAAYHPYLWPTIGFLTMLMICHLLFAFWVLYLESYRPEFNAWWNSQPHERAIGALFVAGTAGLFHPNNLRLLDAQFAATAMPHTFSFQFADDSLSWIKQASK